MECGTAGERPGGSPHGWADAYSTIDLLFVPMSANIGDGDARVALLRGINVGGRNRIAMADLRGLCTEIGLADVRTYIQSGNVVFRSDAGRPELERKLEDAIRETWGLPVSVLVRSGADWARLQTSNPFPQETKREPKLVMLAVSKEPPASDAAERLNERAADGERVIRAGDSLWINFPRGSGRSKLSPTLIDRLVGSPVTTRNWLTVDKIGALLADTG